MILEMLSLLGKIQGKNGEFIKWTSGFINFEFLLQAWECHAWDKLVYEIRYSLINFT